MVIWKRYLLSRFWISLSSLFFLAVIFYASIHHSLHAFREGKTAIAGAPLQLSLLYYLSQISLKAEFILPQLVAIASTITLFSMQSKREILLLQASGLSLKTLICPLVISSSLITLLLYANFQWLHPICEKISVTKEHMDKGTLEKAQEKIPALYLKDQTVLIFSSINRRAATLNNVFWIKGPKTIYAIKKLAFTTPSLPIGLEVSYFSEDENHEVSLTQFFDMKEFPELEFSYYDTPFSKIFITGRDCSFSAFLQAIPWHAAKFGLLTTVPQRILSLLTLFYYMLISPLLCIAAVILSAHLCLRFHRLPKITWAYLVPLGTINIFFVVLKAGMVLANNSVLPALQVMFIPAGFMLLITLYAYRKLA